MKKIGILGGTFDPVHREHVRLAKEAVKELALDKLIIMPTFLPPHKSDAPLSAEHRLNMLDLAFQDQDKIKISDYEIKKEGKSYTYLTVEHFKSVYPDAELYFFVGGDMLTDFKTWKNPDRILCACNLAVFDRENFFTDYGAEEEYFYNNFGKTFIKLNLTGKSFSATKVRVYSALGLDIKNLVPDAVADYVEKNALYDGGIATDFVKNVLTEKRLIHTANVTVTALKKAKELALDKNKVFTASVLHDCAKYLDPKDFKGFTVPDNMPKAVVHAFLGAFVAENVLKIKDLEIIDAIRYHTTGKANMSNLAKLVFLADMIEEGRNYEGVELLRDLYEKDFDLCFKTALKEEVIHLKNKGSEIYFETLNALDYYTKN